MRTILGRVCVDPLINAALEIPEPSPYGVPVASVQPAPADQISDPLRPFEERQLQNLLQQVNAAPPRVRTAFLKHIRTNRLK